MEIATAGSRYFFFVLREHCSHPIMNATKLHIKKRLKNVN